MRIIQLNKYGSTDRFKDDTVREPKDKKYTMKNGITINKY